MKCRVCFFAGGPASAGSPEAEEFGGEDDWVAREGSRDQERAPGAGGCGSIQQGRATGPSGLAGPPPAPFAPAAERGPPPQSTGSGHRSGPRPEAAPSERADGDCEYARGRGGEWGFLL